MVRKEIKLLYALYCMSFLIGCECGNHILVTSTTASYGGWNQILHISKEILSRRDDNHFITFVIPENYDHYLNTIRSFNSLHSEWNLNNSYQIIYSPSVSKFNMHELNKLQGLQKVNTIMNLMVNSTYDSFETIISLLTLTNYNGFKSDIYPKFQLSKPKAIEYLNIRNKHNQYKLNENKKINILLTTVAAYFPIIACQIFNIPIIERAENVIIPHLEYYNIENYLFYNEPFNIEGYTNVVMTYGERIKTIFQKIFMCKFGMCYCAKYYLSPMIHNKYNKLGEINHLFDVHANNAIISSLGPPVSNTIFHRQRIKQFGFLLYNDSVSDNHKYNIKYKDLFEWINNKEKENIPIILISFGSVFVFEDKTIKTMYNILKQHSRNGEYYRVLWALRQNINAKWDNNDRFETEYFKIRKWIPQFDILCNKNIRLFIGHAGGNGVLESTYCKKLMILFPKGGDQMYNAKRMEILEVGSIIEDRINLSDLKSKIDLFLSPKTSKYYQNKMNKLHKMLLYLGGVKEAVDFIDYIVEFGMGHFIGTDKIYSLPWYQNTLIDMYFIMFVVVAIMYVSCCRYCCTQRKPKGLVKQKNE